MICSHVVKVGSRRDDGFYKLFDAKRALGPFMRPTRSWRLMG